MITFNTRPGAISFLFDNKSVFEFIELLKQMRDNAYVETVIINQHIKEYNTLKMRCFFDDDYLTYHKKEIILWFSEETLEYASYKLAQFITTRDFYPNEFCDFIIADIHMVPKGKRIQRVPVFFLKL